MHPAAHHSVTVCSQLTHSEQQAVNMRIVHQVHKPGVVMLAAHVEHQSQASKLASAKGMAHAARQEPLTL